MRNFTIWFSINNVITTKPYNTELDVGNKMGFLEMLVADRVADGSIDHHR